MSLKNVLFSQVYLPRVGWNSLLNPDNKELSDLHWELKVFILFSKGYDDYTFIHIEILITLYQNLCYLIGVNKKIHILSFTSRSRRYHINQINLIFQRSEIGQESQYQLVLQLVILWKDGLPGTYLNLSLRIFSLATSSLSYLYGISGVRLGSLTNKQPDIIETLSFCFIDVLRIATTKLIFMGCLTLLFFTSLVYSNLVGFVIFFLFISLELLSETTSPEYFEKYNINKTLRCFFKNGIFSNDLGGYKSLANYIQWRKLDLICFSLVYVNGILMSIVYLTSIPACDVLFIKQEDCKGDGQRRTINFSLTLLAFSMISLLQNICELISIQWKNKSFLAWVFLLALKEQKNLKTGEENDKLEDINPIDSEIIHQSINERGLNHDEEQIIVSVHANENKEPTQLIKASKMKAVEVGKHMKDTENENANNDHYESEIIEHSTDESRLNQDEEHIVASTLSREKENTNSESCNLMEYINLNTSETIQMSIKENRLNQDQKNVVASDHSTEKVDSYH